MKFYLALIVACFFLLSSCHSDYESGETITKTTFTAEVVLETQGSILGYVYDEKNQPVANALVQIYSASTTTNQYGVFTLNNVKVDKNGTYLTVRKNGYFLGSDMIYPNQAETKSFVKLMELETNKSFQAADGGVIEITGGGSVRFPANAIAYPDGAGYDGKVNVSAKLLNPNNRSLGDLMPGALVGDRFDKTTVVLGTAGMVAIQLNDDKGNLLQLNGKDKATLSIPALSEFKPATIALWSFDESKGRWKEEGIATLSGESYVAEVSHFSFWNCDAPFPLIHVCGKVADANGKGLANIWIKVETSGFNVGIGSTDADGIFCGKMPKGQVLNFKVIANIACGEPVFSKTLGPFSTDVQLDPFVLTNPPNNLVAKGKVVCNDVAVDDAILIVKAGESTIPIKLNSDGTFNENLSHLYCNNMDFITVFAYDQSTNAASQDVKIAINEDKTLTLNVCFNDCPITAGFDFDCNATKLNVVVSDGSGNYTYKWSNGQTTSFINLKDIDSLLTTVCVNVTDVNKGCSKDFCIEYGGTLRASVSGWCSPLFTVTAYGGFPPYTYIWSNGSTDKVVPNFGIGTYAVTVTDSKGCTVASEIVSAGTPLTAESVPSQCNKNLYALNTSSYTNADIYTPGTNVISAADLSNLDLFVTGFVYNLYLSNGSCEQNFEIQLPRVKNLEAEVTNATCPTCSDGYLTVTIGNECISCTIGNVKILGEDRTTDFTADNAAKKLKAGYYYVVVEDKNTGCYIGIIKKQVK